VTGVAFVAMSLVRKGLRPALLPVELAMVAAIVAHGAGNSIDFTVMYFGLYPGVGS
jgi:hypothetical protein